jgi:hypothetical protein
LLCPFSAELFSIPYLYHKLQAIRYVNEQLARGTTANEGTIAAVASLALVEVCVPTGQMDESRLTNQNALGTTDAVACHLQGLARIRELQNRQSRNRLGRRLGLLPRMLLM